METPDAAGTQPYRRSRRGRGWRHATAASLAVALAGTALLLPLGGRVGASTAPLGLRLAGVDPTPTPSPSLSALPTPPPTPRYLPPPLPGLPDLWAEPGQTTSLLTKNPDGTGGAIPYSMTPDGRTLLLYGSGLDDPRHPPASVPGGVGIYVYDMASHSIELASVDSSGHPMQIYVYRAASISDDGNRIAFEGATVPGPEIPFQVWVHDRRLGRTWMVSLARRGHRPGQWSSTDPSISGDGRWVAFMSGADLLGDGSPLPGFDKNRSYEAYLARVDHPGDVVRVGPPTPNEAGPGSKGGMPCTNHDGRYTIFNMWDTTGTLHQVWRWDRLTGAMALATVADDGSPADGLTSEYGRSLDGSGNYVVFASGGILVDGGTWGQVGRSDYGTGWNFEIYRHNMTTAKNDLVSVDYTGAPGHLQSDSPTISGNGKFVSFLTWSALARGDTNYSPYDPGYVGIGAAGADIYVANMETRALQRESTATDGTQGNANMDPWSSVSDDGTRIVFSGAATDFSSDPNSAGLFLRTRSAAAASNGSPITLSPAAAPPRPSPGSRCCDVRW